VFNWKLNIILGGTGMVLSFVIGLISGARFPFILIRASVFGVVFLGLGIGLWFLINRFIPELLYPDGGSEDKDESGLHPGSRIDITLGDGKILPEMFRNIDNSEGVGDIGELIDGTFKPAVQLERGNTAGEGVDQMPEEGYTGNNSQSGHFPGDSMGGMPDLDLMTGSFTGSSNDMPEEMAERPLPERKPVGNKPHEFKGDFNPKELAAGIRTMLSEDE